MTKKIRTIVTVIALFCIAFTSLPMMKGELGSYAMTKTPKSPKVINLTVSPSGKKAVKLSWNKVKSPGKGYAVFRDGVLIKRLDKNTTSYTDKGLKKGRTYSYCVKAYKVKKIKQYYNKKTQKWQNKRIKKAKKRTVPRYKFSKASAVKTITLAKSTRTSSSDDDWDDWSDYLGIDEYIPDNNNGDNNTNSSTEPSEPFPTDKEITLTYSANNSDVKTTIYLGQPWTTNVLSNLKRGSSGYVAYDRKQLYWSEVDRVDHSGRAFFFDVGDYDNFLKVDVVDGKIIGWQTNAAIMGESHGLVLRRGDVQSKDENSVQKRYIWRDFMQTSATKEVLGLDYPIGGLIIGGFQAYWISADNSTIDMTSLRSSEKMIGLHYINAARVMSGRGKLKYNNYLDGGSKTVTLTEPLTVRFTYFTDGVDREFTTPVGKYRYGAQPAAETVNANAPKFSHYFERDGLTKGPQGNMDVETRHELVNIASGYTVKPATEIFAGVLGGSKQICGEFFLNGFSSSVPHLAYLFGKSFTQIGLGGYESVVVDFLA